ncbi:MAG: hypothetical protein ACD_52C00327G0002 [uncultured bacterium]|uniref:Uncharacterized protein n=1 Tax=Candidatus Woesebacteria bacterium RIFCSPHIGHO2_12_FULL_41_24 TaxID=1802510 RepID=A0A1F8AS75_9BACT|nr:MAG: hypothetical protein ACD_52C00327G0002 [uncultured bacterium]OGM14090.1 MAG: hypothetical protein A2W15_03405 [Candidatus Woesebacteria bacterium RBG_16_41_13]OGM29402.1 MAG: hypothetical protein A2873_04660 [Candidatus Woesebacteria bacterium RIFCSPHIGHO2_01_FULL_42_80]OGM34851.1 MAG: hypothetical protein A3D84_03215 [Candidatus Woesebacteria bacterium RIFCSPHIGHO2_02_FULL_42_20]OGM54480.1 MAG: hypothetical protein A3E44_00250 [Candidatus Woesebacteria bacterium RIFCSPHIGHO2_12_FULL_41
MTERIFIYGVPGVGKTRLSKIFGKNFNMPVVEMDRIKRKARKGKTKDRFPFLYLGTCKAYCKFGGLNKENTIKGLIAVRLALRKAVADEAKKYTAAIFEGAFLDPYSLKRLGRPILLTTANEKRHRIQFLYHVDRLLDLKSSEFKSARMIQEYLTEEAKILNIEIVDNSTSVESVPFW